jgi:hypothetical protein
MKRVLLSACLVFGSFGLTGCDGGGVQEGMPEDAKKVDVPLNSIPANAAEGPKMPAGGTGVPAKDKGAPKAEAPATPPAPDTTKN